MSPTTRPRGFTLLELVISIAVIAILASVVAVSLNRSRDKSNYQGCVSNVVLMSQSMERYRQANDFYPTVLSTSTVLQRAYGITQQLYCPGAVPPAFTYTLDAGTGGISGYAYTLYCRGAHHKQLTGLENIPQYSSVHQKVLPERSP